MSIEKAYNIWAKTYDTNKNNTRDLDALVTKEVLEQYAFNNVLEFGCGTGKNTLWLVDRAKSMICLDFSEEMLTIAKEKVPSPKVKFHKADLNLPLDIIDEYADLIVCNLVLEHIDKLDFVFSQAYLKADKGALFYICELHPMKQYSGSQAKYESEKGTEFLEVYIHHTSDYLEAAKKSGFKLKQLDEWFDEDNRAGIPRLISFVFMK